MLAAAWLSRSVAGTVETLGLMGFDEPRAHLIAALSLGAIAAAIATLVTGDRRTAVFLGFIGWLGFFGATLREETNAARLSSGLNGVFDPIGYAFSIVTFVLMSLVFAWAAATLALEVRRGLIRLARRARIARRTGHDRGWVVGRVVFAVALAVSLAMTLSLFTDMIDYTPDIAFVRGAPAQVGLTGGLPPTDPGIDDPAIGSQPAGTPGTPAPGSTPTPTPGPTLPSVGIEDGGTLSVTPGAIADARAGHFPATTGSSSVDHATLPAPWTGGYATTVDIYVRLPGGYDPTRHYPTVYVTPNPYSAWINAVRLHSTVDSLEASGTIPAMIYIFAPAVGGPHPVTQCIDSKDGLQQWDTFMSSTLIAWVDSHYATLADPAARTIMGSSQGAYCSADLLSRHPDVWHQEISFVGYYDAAPRNPRTLSGGEVFGGDEALMDAYSPIKLVPNIPVETRAKMFYVLVGLSSQDFFGPEMDRFSRLLDSLGYGRAVIETPFGHSWKTEESFLPRALMLVGARLVQQGLLP